MSSMKGCMRGRARVLIVKHFCPAQKHDGWMQPLNSWISKSIATLLKSASRELGSKGQHSIMLTSCKSIKKNCTQPGSALMQCHAMCSRQEFHKRLKKSSLTACSFWTVFLFAFQIFCQYPSSVAKYQVFKL